MSSRIELLAGCTNISNLNGFLVKVRFCQAETSVVFRLTVHKSRQFVQEFVNIEFSDLSGFLTSVRSQQSDWQHFCLCACTDQVREYQGF